MWGRAREPRSFVLSAHSGDDASVSIQLSVVAFLFLVMAIGAFLNPRTYLVPFVGIAAETADARNEIQAVYGGFGVAIAVVLLLPIWMPVAKTGVIIAVAGALAGMAVGRIIAALRERPGRWPRIFFVVESTGAALLLSAL
jgi:uncharacterized membrane protein